VGNPQLAAKGAAIASLACYAVISAINLIVLRVRIKGGPRLARLFIKPLISSAFMGLAAVFVYKGVSVLALSAGLDTQSRLWMGVCMLAAIVIAVVVYFIAIVLTKAITADDLALVPKGSKISRFLRIKM
jgi:stage V sporulation protein B